MSKRYGPIRRGSRGFSIHLEEDEASLILRLVGELRELISGAGSLEILEASDDGDDRDDERDDREMLIRRLFPVVHPDDPEAEAEYQRLMRDELTASKQAAFDTVESVLAPGRWSRTVSEAELLAVMQSINSIRLVLGSILQTSDDPSQPEVAEGFEDSPEYHLYDYLSWLLDCSVRAMSAGD